MAYNDPRLCVVFFCAEKPQAGAKENLPQAKPVLRRSAPPLLDAVPKLTETVSSNEVFGFHSTITVPSIFNN